MVKSATNKTAELQKQLDDLSYIQEVIDNYNNTEITYNEFIEIDKATQNYNIELTAFLNELEQKMPTDFVATAFSVSDTGVTMTIQVSSKEEAAEVIAQLRTFDSVSVISTGSFSETTTAEIQTTTDADGNEITTTVEGTESSLVTFSVSLTYAQYGVTDSSDEASEEVTE
jgi:type IV pilus assembly protein PilM